ncbi:hypothetical protein MNBD_ALPHA08-226 [hydrothermal vent metagenome]|uniref:Uncharacterized protein n=1 Tax=hydrothermal vent metagenome TaxID=652676 RepID=A0A3B0S0K7_9ZZZZ
MAVVVITGGASGIGLETAIHLQSLGCPSSNKMEQTRA